MAREVLRGWNPVVRLEMDFWRSRGVKDMLSQCANPRCAKPFLKLREGKLFLVETNRLTKPGESVSPPFVRARQQQRQVEHYWLCDGCATQWTLVYDGDRGIGLQPLHRPVASAPIALAAACPEIA